MRIGTRLEQNAVTQVPTESVTESAAAQPQAEAQVVKPKSGRVLKRPVR